MGWAGLAGGLGWLGGWASWAGEWGWGLSWAWLVGWERGGLKLKWAETTVIGLWAGGGSGAGLGWAGRAGLLLGCCWAAAGLGWADVGRKF